MDGRIFPLLAPVLVLLVLAPAVAAQEAAGGPALEEASVRVVQGEDGARVTERLVVAGAEGSVGHVLARLGGTGVEDLGVRADGGELDVSRERGDLVDTISVTVPEGAGERFEYEVSYRYSEGAEAGKVPLVVPEAPTAGDAPVVTLGLVLPEGSFLNESFPVLNAGGDGEASAAMTSFPSFVSFEVGPSPGGLFTASNVYTALSLAFIVGCVVALLLYDRRSGGQEVAHA